MRSHRVLLRTSVVWLPHSPACGKPDSEPAPGSTQLSEPLCRSRDGANVYSEQGFVLAAPASRPIRQRKTHSPEAAVRAESHLAHRRTRSHHSKQAANRIGSFAHIYAISPLLGLAKCLLLSSQLHYDGAGITVAP